MQRAAKQLSLFNDEPGADTPGFSVRVSGRAKRMSIKVYPRGRVEVVAPKRSKASDVEAFVTEHSDWIEKTRAAFAEHVAPEAFALPERIALPAIDVNVRVCYQPRADKLRLREHGDVLVLRGNVDDEGQCVDALVRWLKKTAKRRFEPQLRSLSLLTGNAYKRMQVRGQKTCWGSHSSTGTISINYSLLFLAPELVRYLMIHELCHAQHMNHSESFWRLVERFEPDYRTLDQQLSAAWRDVPVWLGLH
ncbi:MAG: SprT family zinc-dependent metalloprotease [Pseudomonadota bacterium]